MSCQGRIARLPETIRDQLNQRLADGADGKSLLAWLNQLPEVQTILAEHFHAEPVSHANLSPWRKRGYQDWLRNRAALAHVQQTARQWIRLEHHKTEQNEREILLHERRVKVIEQKAALAISPPADLGCASRRPHPRLHHRPLGPRPRRKEATVPPRLIICRAKTLASQFASGYAVMKQRFERLSGPLCNDLRQLAETGETPVDCALNIPIVAGHTETCRAPGAASSLGTNFLGRVLR
jgi:hypothetical protein